MKCNVAIEAKRFLLFTVVIYVILAVFSFILVGIGLFLYLLKGEELGPEKLQSVNISSLFLSLSFYLYLPFSVISAAILESRHLATYKRLGLISNSVNTQTEAKLILTQPLDVAFNTCQESLKSLLLNQTYNATVYSKNFQIITSDLHNGILIAKTDFFSTSKTPDFVDYAIARRRKIKGELVSYHLTQEDGDKTIILIKSKARLFFGLSDAGQNYLNIENIKKFFTEKNILIGAIS
jgi:hypothetical protein